MLAAGAPARTITEVPGHSETGVTMDSLRGGTRFPALEQSSLLNRVIERHSVILVAGLGAPHPVPVFLALECVDHVPGVRHWQPVALELSMRAAVVLSISSSTRTFTRW
jgi:hypothetical protein